MHNTRSRSPASSRKKVAGPSARPENKSDQEEQFDDQYAVSEIKSQLETVTLTREPDQDQCTFLKTKILKVDFG